MIYGDLLLFRCVSELNGSLRWEKSNSVIYTPNQFNRVLSVPNWLTNSAQTLPVCVLLGLAAVAAAP